MSVYLTKNSPTSSFTAIIAYTPNKDLPCLSSEKAITRLQNIFMESSFKAQIADYQHFHRWGKGDIIVLAGTSTAGKSSIVRALKQLEPGRIEEDLDLKRDPRLETHPGMQLEMIDDAIDHSLRGKNVVVHVDQGYKFLQRIFERNISAPVRVVLAFCPFRELSKRLTERNNKAKQPDGDIKNFRDPLMPIANFGELYTQKKGTGKGLETITHMQATTAFNDHFDEMIEYAKHRGSPLPSETQIIIDKKLFLIEFLSNLGFKDDLHVVEIEPRNKAHYNLIFDTYEHRDEHGLAEIAKILHAGTYTQTTSRIGF